MEVLQQLRFGKLRREDGPPLKESNMIYFSTLGDIIEQSFSSDLLWHHEHLSQGFGKLFVLQHYRSSL
jgi:hypothetical protein